MTEAQMLAEAQKTQEIAAQLELATASGQAIQSTPFGQTGEYGQPVLLNRMGNVFSSNYGQHPPVQPFATPPWWQPGMTPFDPPAAMPFAIQPGMAPFTPNIGGFPYAQNHIGDLQPHHQLDPASEQHMAQPSAIQTQMGLGPHGLGVAPTRPPSPKNLKTITATVAELREGGYVNISFLIMERQPGDASFKTFDPSIRTEVARVLRTYEVTATMDEDWIRAWTTKHVIADVEHRAIACSVPVAFKQIVDEAFKGTRRITCLDSGARWLLEYAGETQATAPKEKKQEEDGWSHIIVGDGCTAPMSTIREVAQAHYRSCGLGLITAEGAFQALSEKAFKYHAPFTFKEGPGWYQTTNQLAAIKHFYIEGQKCTVWIPPQAMEKLGPGFCKGCYVHLTTGFCKCEARPSKAIGYADRQQQKDDKKAAKERKRARADELRSQEEQKRLLGPGS